MIDRIITLYYITKVLDYKSVKFWYTACLKLKWKFYNIWYNVYVTCCYIKEYLFLKTDGIMAEQSHTIYVATPIDKSESSSCQ
jgi:hypothetical protein